MIVGYPIYEICSLNGYPDTPMRQHHILEEPSRTRRDEFLSAVRRSGKLHGHWISPPKTPEAFDAYLKRLRMETHLSYWVRTEDGELAGVFNISEVVRGLFCSGYLGYYGTTGDAVD